MASAVVAFPASLPAKESKVPSPAREAAASPALVPVPVVLRHAAPQPVLRHEQHFVSDGRNFQVDERIACVQQAPAFQGLSLAESIEVVSASRDRQVLRRETLFRQGEPVRQVSLLRCGRVKVTRVTAGGDEVILMLSGPGEIVGGLGSAMQSSHETTAKALETCDAVVWDTRVFAALAERFPVLQRNIVKILAERLQNVEERFSELATGRVSARLARMLIRLAYQIGRPVEGGVLLGLSREELAQVIGTTLFTVSRLLSQWEDRGLLIARREAVLVLDSSGLGELAEAA